jgi:hypothetical protein
MKVNKRLSYLQNRHIGERVVIVANGPSLNSMDLSFLRNETTIGLNKIFLGFRKFHFYPKYYVAVNAKVLQQSADAIKTMNCVKFISTRAADYIPEDALTYHINTPCVNMPFFTDISQGVHEGWTVTYAAMQIAYFLGFEEVVLIGLDHRFKYSGQPNEAKFLKGNDPNHFSSEYFKDQHWDNPDFPHMEESYQIARSVFEHDNRQIIDATVNGACTIFEKVDYRNFF